MDVPGEQKHKTLTETIATVCIAIFFGSRDQVAGRRQRTHAMTTSNKQIQTTVTTLHPQNANTKKPLQKQNDVREQNDPLNIVLI